MSQGLRKLFGSYLIRGCDEQKQIVNEIPCETTIGLYFSSENSKISKEFSEHLSRFYEDIKKSGRHLFEVIVVPLEEPQDRNSVLLSWKRKTHFLIFHGDDATIKEEYLIRKYSVQESPTLILIDGTSGHVINFEGRQKILQDPDGIQFPWRYPTFSQILESGNLVANTETDTACTSSSATTTTTTTTAARPSETNSSSSTCTPSTPPTTLLPTKIKDNIKGFYFAAFWCPPCRTFLSTLMDAYNRINKEKHIFDVIFVSSDRSKESFSRFFSDMPWLAIPYEDEQRRQNLTAAFNIKSIPTLIITDSQDNIITSEGRVEINEDLEALDFPWHPKIVEELRDKHTTILNNTLCLIYFLSKGDDDSEYENAEGILRPIATEIAESDIEEAFQPKFYIASDSELTESLQLFMDLDESSAHLVILDIPNFRYAVLTDVQILDEESTREFLHKFQAAQLKYRYIQSRFI